MRALLAAGVKPAEIGVITPYNAQVLKLREELHDEREAAAAGGGLLEVGTVDGFQGREKEAIVISMVRSNPRRSVGFLSEARRMNVAVTRGRRHVCLVGDSETAAAHPFLRRLLDYFGEHGEVRSAAEYGEAPATHRPHAPPPAAAASAVASTAFVVVAAACEVEGLEMRSWRPSPSPTCGDIGEI